MRLLVPLLLGLASLSCTESQPDPAGDKALIETIFAAADSQEPEGLDAYLAYMEEDVILMPHDHPAVEGKAAYKAHVESSWMAGDTEIRHELIDFDAFDEVVIARGRASGTFQPAGSMEVYPFETKNVFVFKRAAGGLKVWRVIFNMNPQEP
ncbi:MAG: nuclear transport factor 2 family protein [Bacteroidota bacterium]